MVNVGSYIKRTSTGMALGASLVASGRRRAREPYAPSDWDLAEMADRGSTKRGMAISDERRALK